MVLPTLGENMTENEKYELIKALQTALCLYPGTDECMDLVRPAFAAIAPVIEKIRRDAEDHGWHNAVRRDATNYFGPLPHQS